MKYFLLRVSSFIERKINFFKNLFSNAKIFYVVEQVDWVITDIAKSIKNYLGDEFQITKTHKGIRNSIIHFGSINSILSQKGINVPHISNKIIVSYNHVISNDERHKFIKKLNRIVDIWHVTNSKAETDLNSLGIPKRKIVKIPLGIDLKKFQPCTKKEKIIIRKKLGIPENKIVIGSFQKDGVGWGEGYKPKLIKGPDIFCNVVSKYAKNENVFILLTGPSRGYVKRQLIKRKIPFLHVILKDQKDIVEYYRALDIYLITSRNEGGPMSVLESMATGIPIISSKVGIAIDLIRDNFNGYLVDIENEKEFLLKLKKLCADENKKMKLKLEGLKTIENLDWKKISDKKFQLYQILLQNNN